MISAILILACESSNEVNLMNAPKEFWEEIAKLIAAESGGEHPKQWNKPRIDAFLYNFQLKLEQICQADEQKAQRCGISSTRSKEGEVQSPTLTYYSFRRIFLTQESMGNRTTRDMFAIYLGYDSAYDLIERRGVFMQETSLKASKFSFRNKRINVYLLILVVVFGLLGWFCIQLPAKETPFLFVRSRTGITMINLNSKKLIPLVTGTPDIIGFDYDPQSRMLFWAEATDYTCWLSSVRLNQKLTGVEVESWKNRLNFNKMGIPTGVVLDTRNKLIYCADYGRPMIWTYNYHGKLLDSIAMHPFAKKLSSIELDPHQRVLYWTDVELHKIGKINLETRSVDPNFLTQVGKFPDGLSIDTLHNRLYWASYESGQIGWSPLNQPQAHLLYPSSRVSAVEVDAVQNVLYNALRDAKIIRKVPLPSPKPGTKMQKLDDYLLDETELGVIKLFKLKK